MKTVLILLCIVLMAVPSYASTLDGYDRSALADENYTKAHNTNEVPEAKNDPELAAVMKKYVYADIARQAKITQTERKLVEIVVLTTNQNHKFLSRIVDGALNIGVKPIEIREALYHVAPYIGFPKVFEALDVANEVFTTYGERINAMRDSTPDYQKHLQDDLSAFCFGDTYTRGTLDYKMREMLTMAVIGTLGTGEPQYKSHVAGTLDAGATKEEVIGIITTMNPYIGFPRTLNALRIANEVFAEREKK